MPETSDRPTDLDTRPLQQGYPRQTQARRQRSVRKSDPSALSENRSGDPLANGKVKARRNVARRNDTSRQSNQSLLTCPWQRRIRREKQRKTCCCYENRQRDKPNRLFPQERSIRFRAVREVGARQSVADPKQSGQTEVKQIERTRLRIRITMR
jgi:hypothetical protein